MFPIEVADTSGEPPNPGWPGRVDAVTAELAEQLAATGAYRAKTLHPERDGFGALQPIHRCDGCWREIAEDADADLVAITVVHKMSTLISSLHIWLLDVREQRIVRNGAVSLRGDTDEAWRRAVSFLLRRGILRENGGQPMLSSPFPGG